MSGRGTIHSFTIVNRPFHESFADEVPFAIVLVDIEEGTRIIGRWASSLEQLRIGIEAEAVFAEVEDTTLVYWAIAT